MERKIKKVSDYVVAELDNRGRGIWVFENNRGMNINGNRTIHMANWKIQDIEAILLFLKINGEKGGDKE
jgi:hypothetical protein